MENIDPSVTAVMLLLAERTRQRTEEGWTQEHDDEHWDGDLALAACCYAQSSRAHPTSDAADLEDPPIEWPWDKKWWKPVSQKRDLVRAGALILAELERLERAELAAGTQMA